MFQICLNQNYIFCDCYFKCTNKNVRHSSTTPIYVARHLQAVSSFLLSLSHALSLTPYTRSLSYTRYLDLTQANTISPSLSYTHTHTQTNKHIHYLSLKHTHTHSFSLSRSHVHTQTQRSSPKSCSNKRQILGDTLFYLRISYQHERTKPTFCT